MSPSRRHVADTVLFGGRSCYAKSWNWSLPDGIEYVFDSSPGVLLCDESTDTVRNFLSQGLRLTNKWFMT